jgi:hemerythrin
MFNGVFINIYEVYMALITWNESFAVNIKQIDEQHKGLVELVNSLHDAMKAGKGNDVMGPILSDLMRYTAIHFSTEEKLFEQFAYPENLRHKMEHDDLTSKVKAFSNDFRSGKLSVTIEVMHFLRDWLRNHILGSDLKYAPFLKNKGVC